MTKEDGVGESNILREEDITPEQAEVFLRAKKQQRADQCIVEVEKILEQYQCQIRAYPRLTADGRIITTAEIVAV